MRGRICTIFEHCAKQACNITLARTILGEKMDEGRTAQVLGISHMDKEALFAFIEG